jgi:hypothetical protein
LLNDHELVAGPSFGGDPAAGAHLDLIHIRNQESQRGAAEAGQLRTGAKGPEALFQRT